MATRITIAIRKGGCGKTDTAVNLAAALGHYGQKALLVDLDPQFDATMYLDLYPTDNRHLFTAFMDESFSIKNAIVKTDFKFDFIPSHMKMDKVDKVLDAEETNIIKDLLKPLDDEYDFIIFDTGPSRSNLTVNAFHASDYVLIPMQTHPRAMGQVPAIIHDIEVVKKSNPGLELLGVLPTMFSPTNIQKAVLDEAKERFAGMMLPLCTSYLTHYVEATALKMPLINYNLNTQGSETYLQLAKILMEKSK